MAKKLGIETPLRFKSYTLIERAVEEGLPGGYYKAHKHTDKPTEAQIFEQQLHYVMLNLEDILQFGNDE